MNDLVQRKPCFYHWLLAIRIQCLIFDHATHKITDVLVHASMPSPKVILIVTRLHQSLLLITSPLDLAYCSLSRRTLLLLPWFPLFRYRWLCMIFRSSLQLACMKLRIACDLWDALVIEPPDNVSQRISTP
jgi:hypothetical protein